MSLAAIASSLTIIVFARFILPPMFLALMVVLSFHQVVEAAPGGKTEALPVQKAAPAAVVIETGGSEVDLRQQMRTRTGVTELKNSPIRFSQAPTGSYGFIAPKHLGMALITQSPDLMLERVPASPDAYEIHKLSDGSGMLVGFVEQGLAPQIMLRERPKSLRLSLHSNPSGKAPLIAAVPLEKLMVDQMPRRLDRNNHDSPVLLEMDLQGPSNRKSPGQ